MYNPVIRSRTSGYTLVELSIVIIIISLLTASGLAMGASMVERAGYVDTAKLLDQLEESLRDYYVVNGRLPCVAHMSTALGSSGFGEEITGCAAGAATGTDSARIAAGGDYVRVGMIPVRTLGLPDSAASDKFGSRILYAVTESLTEKSTFGSTDGVITVQDASDNPILTDAAYFIGSHGRDRNGAYAYSTGNGSACDSTGLDTLNCSYTEEFRDAPFNNGDDANFFFDDVIRWAPVFHFMALDTESSSLWVGTASGDGVVSVGLDGDTSDTNVGIGTSNPQERLHVDGKLRLGDRFTIDPDLPYAPGLPGTTIYGETGTTNHLTFYVQDSKSNGASITLAGRNAAFFDSGRITYRASYDYTAGVTTNRPMHHFYRIDSSGTAYALAEIQANGDMYIYGSAYGKASDRRLKQDFRPIEDALEKLLQIHGTYYRWNDKAKNEDKKTVHIGVIAQDVQAVFPELVNVETDGFLSLDYGNLTPVIIEAIRELKAENEALRAEIHGKTASGHHAEYDPLKDYRLLAAALLIAVAASGMTAFILRKR